MVKRIESEMMVTARARLSWGSLAALALSLAVLQASAAVAEEAAAKAPETTWHNVTTANVGGQAWSDVQAPFDRLPARAEKIVRPEVWGLSHDSSGLNVDFETDAAKFTVRWKLNSQELSFAHMTATGVSGVDVYVQDEAGWHYLETGKPAAYPDNQVDVSAPRGREGQAVRYRVYLPLYNGVSSVEVGVPAEAELKFIDPSQDEKPVVIYGTSITQGCSASRPGMAYPAILGRRLGREIVNLGFSGNGKTEPEVATLIAELDPAVLVIDSLPNLAPELLAERMPGFIEIFRKSHPETPILLVQNPIYPTIPLKASPYEKVMRSSELLAGIHADRVAAGDKQIGLVAASDWSVDGGDATVDGVHPTDVGFVMLADELEPQLREALGMPAK